MLILQASLSASLFKSLSCYLVFVVQRLNHLSEEKYQPKEDIFVGEHVGRHHFFSPEGSLIAPVGLICGFLKKFPLTDVDMILLL